MEPLAPLVDRALSPLGGRIQRLFLRLGRIAAGDVRRYGDPLGSFFLCFLPILIVDYPLLVYGVDGSKHGTIPPWSVWAGNVLLAAWGLWLLCRVLRY